LTNRGARERSAESARSGGFRSCGHYDFTRLSAALMLPGGAAVMLCLDRGGLSAGKKRGQIYELSLRLQYGDPAPMLELAAGLEQKYELRRELYTKYERLLNKLRSRK
ncbi:MAG: hypothetical protein FWH06_02960, partial [Oscillospiraceae bacterium]|nr:hypothetical protein [Oscillospiraceae bacterium]